MEYTEKKIKGVMPKKYLNKGYALVLEGGGMRGFYSSGVFDAFIDEGLMFPYIIGVSAGASNVLSYISGQKGRSRVLIEKYVDDSRYMSYKNMFKLGSFFGYEYVFKTIPDKHLFWDREIYNKVKTKFYTGTTDINTGETVWFDKDEFNKSVDPLIASCALPFMAKPVCYKGYELLDGGISNPLPIEKAINDGNKFFVIVLTRNVGYLKKPFKFKRLLNKYYGKYPKFVEIMLKRHEIYNEQLALCEKLEKEGRAIIIRPQKELKISRTSKNIKKPLMLHDEGYEEGKEAIIKLKEVLSNEKV